jgi:predicted  nucleic acid-binding Zn-ribbon protein
MKKLFFSVLALGLVVVSCQNYDDEFASLHDKIANLETKIATLSDLQSAVSTLQSNVSSIATAVAAVSSDVNDLGAFSQDLAQILADISDLQSQLADASDDQIAAMQSEIATLQGALTALINGNATAIAGVLTAVEANGGDLDSLMTSIASVSTDLAGVLAAVTSSSEAVIEAVLAAIVASENVLAEDIAEVLLAENTNSDALAAAIAAVAAQLDAQDASALSNFTAIMDAVAAGFDGQSTALADALASILAEMDIDNAAVMAALSTLLDLQVTYVGDLAITNNAELEFAESLGTKVQIIKGDLIVTVSAANSLDIARVNAVVSQIEAVVAAPSADSANNDPNNDTSSVTLTISTGDTLDMSALRNISGDLNITSSNSSSVDLSSLAEVADNGTTGGDVTIVADASLDLSALATITGNVDIDVTSSIDLSGLTTVSGNYDVAGHDIADQALATVGGDVTLDYDGGYVQPNLATAGAITVTDYATDAAADPAVVGTLEVDFSGATTVTSLSTAGAANANTVVFASATSITIGEIAVDNITAPSAINIAHNYTSLVNGATTSFADLTITAAAATDIHVAALDLGGTFTVVLADSGSLQVDAAEALNVDIVGGESINFDAAAFYGNVDIDMNDAGTATFPNLTDIEGATFSVDGLEVTLEALVNADATLTLANDPALNFPALVTASDITAVSATDGSFPLLYINSVIDMAADATISAKGVTDEINQLHDADQWADITLTAQEDDFSTATFISLEALTVTGVVDSTNASTVYNLEIDSDNVLLASATIDGDWDTVTVGTDDAADALESLLNLSTEGTMESFILQHTVNLVSISMNHIHSSPLGTSYTIDGNESLTSFTTAANIVVSFIVTNNPALTEFDASSIDTEPADADSDTRSYDFVFTISGNDDGLGGGLVGTHVANDASNPESFTQSSISSIATYIENIYAVVGDDAANADPDSTIAVSISYYDTGTGATVVGDDDAIAGSDGFGAGINTLVEVQKIN